MTTSNAVNSGSLKTVSQLEAQFTDMAQALDQLQSLCAQLEEELSGVLGERSPEKDEPKNLPEPALVPRAEAVRNYRKAVVSASERLESILSRLEA